MKKHEQILDRYSCLLDHLKEAYDVSEVHDDIHRIAPKTRPHNAKKVALVALTHGDEVIGLHIFIELLLTLLEGNFQLEGELFLIIAHRQAYLKNQRYIDVDLNRVYDQEPSSKIETQRVRFIKDVVRDCDYIIDIHQCIEDTLTPFFILPFSKESYAWINAVAPNIPVIISPDITQVTTLSSYGFLSGKKAVTFEVGSRDVNVYQLELGIHTIKDFLKAAWAPSPRISQIFPLRCPTPTYEIKYFQPYSQGDVSFCKDFKNFEAIKKGQVIAYVDNKEVQSPLEGNILLYPQKWFKKGSVVQPDGLFFVLQETDLHKIS